MSNLDERQIAIELTARELAALVRALITAQLADENAVDSYRWLGLEQRLSVALEDAKRKGQAAECRA